MSEVFTDVTLVPVDDNIPPDEKDRPDEEKRGEHIVRFLASASLQQHLVIPFTHPIKIGTKGKDVVGVKRSLWKSVGLKLPINPTETFGAIAVQQLKLFQRRHGLAVDGVLGPSTLKKLAPFFDAYSFFLYEGYAPGMDSKDVMRKKFVAYALWGYNNRPSIHYVQSRPMDHLNDLYHLPEYEDCSQFYTKTAKAAGISDPNGLNYNGAGYTGTLGSHGVRVTNLASALPGDAILYGSAPSFEHVACYIGNGRVVSHGSEGGPYLLMATYRPISEIRRYI